MTAPLFSGLDMADEIGFALAAVPQILRDNPELASRCDATNFNLIRSVASCVFFVREFDIEGRGLADLLPVAEQWVRDHGVGYFIRPDEFNIAAIWRGYTLVDGAFARSRKRA